MAKQTLLNVIESACYELGQTPPSTLVGATDINVLRFLHLLYAVGRDVRNKYDLPSLKRSFTFTTVDGTKLYPLPGDYWRATLGTAWDESNSWMLFGPEDDAGIVGRDKGVAPYGTQYSYRIAGAIEQTVGQASFDRNSSYFEVSPTPGNARTLYLEYISANWFYPVEWAASTGYTSGDFVSANGAIYKATSTGTSNTTRPSGESTTTGETGVSFQLWRDHYNVLTADTDYPIIDPELLIAGLKFRWKQAHGVDFAMEQQQFVDTLRGVMTRFQGEVEVSGDGPILYELPITSEGFVSTGW